MKPTFAIVTGPTASGKTALAHEWARRKGLPILSADSMQVYGDLPVLTAAPTAQELAEVDYRLVGILPPIERFDAARFVAAAEELAWELIGAGHVRGDRQPDALVVGGTGFYIEALRRGLAPMPAIPAEIKLNLQERLEKDGLASLYTELEKYDPAAAARIEANDRQRVLRALGIIKATGHPFSSFHTEDGDTWSDKSRETRPYEIDETIVLMPDREKLYDRINTRTVQMFEVGLLDEIAALMQNYSIDDVENALRPLGARDLAEAMQRGEITTETPPNAPELAPHIAALQQNTRRYAKRQITWIRRHSPKGENTIKWIED